MLSRFFAVIATLSLVFLAGCAGPGRAADVSAAPAPQNSQNATTSAASMISPATGY